MSSDDGTKIVTSLDFYTKDEQSAAALRFRGVKGAESHQRLQWTCGDIQGNQSEIK